jgi:trehalose synthase-fused probable maltokinase
MSDGAPTTARQRDVHVDAITDEVVAAWMATQRWYASKGLEPRLRVIGSVDGDVDGARVTTRFVIDEAPATPVLYQVPLVFRTGPASSQDADLVATDGAEWCYDGPHDPAYVRWLLDTMAESENVAGESADVEGRNLVDPGRFIRSRVLSGEQSNTSIICDVDDGPLPQVIVKVFRVLHHGDNPDVTTQAALSGGGSTHVPTSVGALRGTWPDAGRDSGSASGHLAFAQEFLPGLDDAWRVALRAATDGTSFADDARSLGVAVAEVHATLARELPTVPADAEQIRTALDTMRGRLDVAAAEVPELADHVEAIRRAYDLAAGSDWPPLQRIHGDLHLGQALLSPLRGWELLDFEGEPLRPLPERSRPDVTLRDVAGMLRSFDYVAGALAHQDDPVDARSWADEARTAFVDGYQTSTGTDLGAQQALLDAFEIDKAVYEAVYEARNRPTWLEIPVMAVARLVVR